MTAGLLPRFNWAAWRAAERPIAKATRELPRLDALVIMRLEAGFCFGDARTLHLQAWPIHGSSLTRPRQVALAKVLKHSGLPVATLGEVYDQLSSICVMNNEQEWQLASGESEQPAACG